MNTVDYQCQRAYANSVTPGEKVASFSCELVLNITAIILTALHMLLILTHCTIRSIARVAYHGAVSFLLATMFIFCLLLFTVVYLASTPILNNNLP